MMKRKLTTKEEISANIQTLIKEYDDFNQAEDVYCALVKQMMLRSSALN